METRSTQKTSSSPAHKETPFALVCKDKHGLEIAAANDAAEKGGVCKGMRLTDARALLPSLVTQPAEPQKDAQALKKLAIWCQRYTPVTAIDGTDSLWLDATGADHLLGGEEKLLKDLRTRLNNLGFENRAGLGPTPGAAWALARFCSKPHIKLHEDTEAALALLPVEALRLSAASLKTLKSFGLKRLCQLLNMPRASLQQRFSSKEEFDSVLDRLDQLLGIKAEPLIPVSPPPLYYERLNFAEPISHTEGFWSALDDLLGALCERLEKDHKGARALTFAAYRTDGGVSHASIQTARPSREREHFAHLFKDKIEKLNPGFGVDCFTLSAPVTQPLTQRQTALGATHGAKPKTQNYNLTALIDRITNRLGPHAITARAPFESHIPEAAESPIHPLRARKWPPSHTPARPVRLLGRPEPIEVIAEIPDGPPRQFRWRRVQRRIVKASGPERIAPEWWHDLKAKNRTRDYYTLEDENGRRYWLYRDGLYEGEEAATAPRWLMHGIFA